MLFYIRQTIYTPRVEEHSNLTNTWRLRNNQRAVSIDNISFMSPCDEFKVTNKENQLSESNYSERNESNNVSTENLNVKERQKVDDDNIIPWRAHLRKTNSRLSLVG